MSLAALETRLRAAALAYPETHEDHPWGESAFKVRGKVFLFLFRNDEGISFSMKLPASREFALIWDFTAPTGYGLGKSGWITCKLDAKTEVDPDLLLGWLDESYRTVAPKKLVATLPSS
ncbi:MmcQ/YjbR family DNA-binding protein [Sphingoaurantiacus capsulatus]|uniref:MmcQ/YjbR family DNA-binding protein n=1 Tax=Sphingoaurantiacus capsulatus TaxID=1771310 RepID=A0ABV7XDX6_9SPHN